MHHTQTRWSREKPLSSAIRGRVICPVPDDTAPTEALLSFYRREGGVATGDQLALMLVDRVDQPISRVARWIVERRLVCLTQRGLLLLPLFQFDLSLGHIKPAVAVAVTILRTRMDDAGIASWFATANPELEQRAPAQVVREGVTSIEQLAHGLLGYRAV